LEIHKSRETMEKTVLTQVDIENAVQDLKAKLQRERDLKREALHRVLAEVSHSDSWEFKHG